ncbi:substrate-binding domain-containing protein [Nocardioides panacihumi]|uniref:Substrate-binding domain-containing protein n=1 Tax=Nocardioides panacihumi TaxID=400774 RepID=A0ABP5CJX5_9ACTN
MPIRSWPVVVATGTVVAVAAGYLLVGLLRDDPAAGCRTTVLRVTAAPEIAPTVAEAAADLGGCTRVEVTSEAPASTASTIGAGSAVDVWIPDSSRWTADLSAGGGLAGDEATPASIASTPVVLAVRAALARGLGRQPTYDALAAGRPETLAAADPLTSAATQAAIADLGAALGSTAELRGRLGAMLKGLHVQPSGLARGAAVQVSTEQQVAAANVRAGRTAYVAVRPAEAVRSMDYPFVVTTFDRARVAAAQALLTRLRGAPARARLARLGFRSGARGVRPLTPADADAALKGLAELARPIRILAAVDVSGSMSRPVPGTGGETRIDLARAALREGMRLFPDHTVAGLWRFSANLTPSTDYEQVVPLTEITASNRGLVAAATDGLTVKPHGGTGLYATTLAAVRAVRAGYDPARVNSVIVLSDGRDEKAEAHNVDLATLLTTLHEEADPDRPVIVNMIAYGPDSDAGAMQQIARATGGTVYAVGDPRELPGVFRDAIGNRLCAQTC